MTNQRLRLITTNDFYGSYFAHPTSYGSLPGAGALTETVDRLREGGPALWIDCGDFAQGGPLAPSSNGGLGFVAVNELRIDVATIGNHEFDWGMPHLQRWITEIHFPLVCANADIGLPAAAILAAGPWNVGVIGLTYPLLVSFQTELRSAQPDPASIVPTEAARLRQEGADLVVVAVHDGVDWSWRQDGTIRPRPERIASLLSTFAGHADVVLGGHSLARWAGPLGGVSYVQPWAFGAEVGVADCFPDGRVEVSTVAVEGASGWKGIGAGLHGALAREVTGELTSPLVDAPMTNRSLPAAVGWGMCQVTKADLALVSPAEFQTMQPPIDGAFAYLPAGSVTEADILRVIPWQDDGIYVAEVTPDEVETLAALMAQPENWADYGPPERFGSISGRSGSVVLNGWYARRLTERLGRDLAWARAGGQRDALRAAVRR